MEAPALWMQLAKLMLWTVEEKVECSRCWAVGWRRRQGTSELQYLDGGQFLDHEEGKTGLPRIMGELAEEIVSKGMEAKEESLWCTSTYVKETEGPKVIAGAWQFWIVPLVKKLSWDSSEFFGRRLQTSMTRATVQDSTAGPGQNPPHGTSSGWWVILPWRLGTVHEFTGT